MLCCSFTAVVLAYRDDVLQSYWLTGCCSSTGLQGAAVSLAVLLTYRVQQFYWRFYWLTGCCSLTHLQGAAVLMNYKVLRFYWLTGAAVLLQSRWLTGMQRCGLRGLQRTCRSNVPERWQDRGRIEWTCCPCVTPCLSCKGFLMSVIKGRGDEQDVGGVTSVFGPSLLWIFVSFFSRSLSVSPPGWFLLCV